MDPEDSQPTAEKLQAYVHANAGKFTDAAITAELLRAGYDRADITAALSGAAAADVSAPVRSRARRIVILAYLLTYGLLVAGMLTNSGSGSYGAGIIGTIVLTVVLGLAFLIAAVWLRRQGSRERPVAPDLTAMIAIPLILLVIVAGACLATGLPIPHAV